MNKSKPMIGWFVLLATLVVHASPQNTFPASGNVGIGTTSPAATLQVLGNVMVGTSAPNCDSPSGIHFYGGISNVLLDCIQNVYLLSGVTLNSNAQAVAETASPVALFTQNDGFHFMADTGKSVGATYTPSERLTISSSSGNVGIGTTAPGAKLEVDGNVKLTSGSGASITFADGTVQSTAYTGVVCGGDYAESVDAIGGQIDYAPGDLLVIDPKAPGRFLKSTRSYSTLVAGIYSTKPGTIGRRATTYAKTDTTAVPMAMMGIVPTKVSAENGPIETGDLLVTSSTMGYAMKGTDRNRLTGAVVGKALGSLDSGTGVIEVLVTLQ